MSQFKKDDLIVIWPGTTHGYNKLVYPVYEVLSPDYLSVNFNGIVRLVDAIEARQATESEIAEMKRDDSIVNAEFYVDQPDIIDLPFAAGLGAEGTYGMSDDQLAKHQQDSLGRHDRMCRNLIVIALLVVAAIAGMNWWVS